ncbi:MAG TPA: aspartyl protease family protein [Pyrinomonadaceae bacterium]|nr:aspartyl protease family protein [Pyrinomonadaceae bacterium]
MKRKTILPLAILLLSLALATALSQQTAPVRSTTTAPVSIPFEMVTRHIIVKVTVDKSPPLSFVFDTGARRAIIDIDRAKELGLNLQRQVRVGGAGSQTLTGAMVQDARWSLAGLEGFSQPISLAIPLRNVAARFGQELDGIIGGEFISQFVVEVDYQAQLLKLHDKSKFKYTGTGEIIPMKLDGQGHPLIEAEVTPMDSKPIRGKFVIDLGSGGALALHSPFVAEHNLLDGRTKTIRAIGVGGAGGQSQGRFGRVAELRIGNFKITNPTTLFSEDKDGAFASTSYAGNIGQRIAGKFRLFLDYTNLRIILEPTKELSELFDRATPGLALRAEDKNLKTFRITDVLEDSPAAEAGIQKDDIIMEVDGRSNTDLNITKLLELFERPSAYKLTIRRGDQTLHVTLVPRRMV